MYGYHEYGTVTYAYRTWEEVQDVTADTATETQDVTPTTNTEYQEVEPS